jgi:hypothetical protein
MRSERRTAAAAVVLPSDVEQRALSLSAVVERPHDSFDMSERIELIIVFVGDDVICKWILEHGRT